MTSLPKTIQISKRATYPSPLIGCLCATVCGLPFAAAWPLQQTKSLFHPNRNKALGGQAMHYYRYGTAKNCSSTYEDLKLCMKIKTKPQDVAKKMWAEREAVKEAARNKEQSSLDVWTLRE
ncbi:hypothetical protein BC936DRAFT_146541 [Jimgerdemannia flammicorona]|uniref:Uncharacterized protein n=1 Tax=Jimgerdemannia flammicorona TaxID=994334 RepID=A0A433D7C4_9FUNG|nr:hypothetical protein BC936DRAFT_146541 [Jimgerdemannia flammicorona]